MGTTEGLSALAKVWPSIGSHFWVFDVLGGVKLFLSQNLDKKIHLENIAIPDLLRRVRKKRQKKTKPSVLLSSKLLGCQRIGYDDSEIA